LRGLRLGCIHDQPAWRSASARPSRSRATLRRPTAPRRVTAICCLIVGPRAG